ncbi:MAG: hypothetical protein CMJ64_25395 [Planctomycetaceae bacterium]|nr:hypothetical protein [Planctomycetaceae bacterium]
MKSQILDNWDEFRERLQGVYEDLASTKAKSRDRGASSSRRTRKASASPRKQKPDMTVKSSDEDE